jgi:hypothetical protein
MRQRSNSNNELKSRASANSSELAQSMQSPTKGVQLKTKIKHSTGKLKVLNEDRTVGMAMEASLDPQDPVVGSATGVNTAWMQSIRKTYPKANVVRGHLLNHDLGGFGVEENLYPISTKANSDHSTKVEQKVKGALTKADKDGGEVNYGVQVKEAKSYEKAQFLCHWEAFDKSKSKIDGASVAIDSDLGTHVGGFGGWGKTEKSPVAWRHGKSKGGTEVEEVRKRLGKAIENKQIEFDAIKDHGGKQVGGAQDYIEELNDLAEEHGAEAVWMTLKSEHSNEKDEGKQKLYVEWMNILSQRPEMIIDVDKREVIDLT